MHALLKDHSESEKISSLKKEVQGQNEKFQNTFYSQT